MAVIVYVARRHLTVFEIGTTSVYLFIISDGQFTNSFRSSFTIWSNLNSHSGCCLSLNIMLSKET